MVFTATDSRRRQPRIGRVKRVLTLTPTFWERSRARRAAIQPSASEGRADSIRSTESTTALCSMPARALSCDHHAFRFCEPLEIERRRLFHVHGHRARAEHGSKEAAPFFARSFNGDFRCREVEGENTNVCLLRGLADLAVDE